MKAATHHPDPVALRLAMAIKRLRARLQEAAPASSTGLPMSQLTILHRLRVAGPTTAAALAAAEHISQQAVAQNLAALKRGKYSVWNPAELRFVDLPKKARLVAR